MSKNVKLKQGGNTMKRFAIVLILVALVLSLGVENTNAQKFPNKEIELIINFPPGGSTDTYARIVGNGVQKILGVPIVFVNKAGAGGAIAADYIKNSDPTGYTIGTGGASNLGTVIATNPKITYNLDDFAVVCRSVVTPIIIVSKKGRFQDFASFVKEAKENPNKLMYGSYGIRSTSHVAGELLKMETGTQIKHIPFESGAKGLAAALGGHVDISILTVATTLPNIKGGNLDALAVITGYRVPDLPDVPNIVELGYPGAELFSHEGFITSAKVPKDKLAIIQDAFARAMQDSEVKDAITKAGMIPSYQSGSEYKDLLVKMLAVYKKVAKEANIIE